MQLGAVSGIAERYPGSTITILSPFPAIDVPFYAPVTVVGCNRRNLVAATWDLIRAFAWRASGRRMGWMLSRTLRLVENADLLIDLSGDMLTDDYGPHVAYSHYVPIMRALILGRPYFICAQSIGPFSWTRPLARHLLRRASAVTVRDSISRSYASTMGVVPERLSQTADLAFLLPAASEQRANDIMRHEGFATDDRPVLGISVSPLIEARFNAFRSGAGHRDFVELMARVIERIVRERGTKVLFLAHVTGPTRAKDDRVISTVLKIRLGTAVESAVLNGNYRPEELKAVISRCSLFCGARMHANIAALSSRVPTVAIAYSHKTVGIMTDCGMGDYVASVESMTEKSLGDLLSRAFREREEIIRRLAENMSGIAAKAAHNLNGLGQLAARPGGAT
jgi:colanic acid/amylovoran biosynthesis protein